MANIAKMKRERMLTFLEELKATHSDDASIRALNEIENHIREKKYGLIWEDHTEAVDEMLEENIPVFCEDPERRLCKDPSLPFNFIIEGDNLQALYLLEKTHRGKVDCIYIDPPYNTGAKDWKYNNDYVDSSDVYRHSKWLSMMKNRLLLAKHLLNPNDSVLICTIDEKEYLRLGCLLEELFPTARIQMVSITNNLAGVQRTAEFGRVDEYAFFVMIGAAAPQRIALNSEWIKDGGRTHLGEIRWDLLRRTGTNAQRSDSPGCFYPIYISDDGKKIIGTGETLEQGKSTSSVAKPGNGVVALWPIRQDGSDGRWQLSQDSFEEKRKKGLIKLGPYKGESTTVYYLKPAEEAKLNDGTYNIEGYREDGSVITSTANSIERKVLPTTQWKISTHDATHYGTRLIKKFIPGREFAFPKSLYAVHDTLMFFVTHKPNAIIVDFFAGSGTTMHAVNLLNKEDGGRRKCILVTNNEVSNAEAKELARKGYRPGDSEWEALGIAHYITWPRIVCSIEGHDINGNPLKDNYIGSNIPMADGFITNVKYFKCAWTPRKPEDYLLSNALSLHIKEMIELQTGYEVDGVKNVLILNRDDFKKVILEPVAYEQVENIWVNQNMIFSAGEMKLLVEKGFKYIPREFFGRELREAAE